MSSQPNTTAPPASDNCALALTCPDELLPTPVKSLLADREWLDEAVIEVNRKIVARTNELARLCARREELLSDRNELRRKQARNQLDLFLPPLRICAIEPVGEVFEADVHQVWPLALVRHVVAAEPHVNPPRLTCAKGGERLADL